MKAYSMTCEQEVSLPYELYESIEGHYFIGQTPVLTATNQLALAALVNPMTSKVNLFINAITLTNLSSTNFSAEVYLRSSFNTGLVSSQVSCVNTSILNPPSPKAQIQYLMTTSTPPTSGISLFTRLVSPFSTLVIDGGQMIIAPGQSLVLYLGRYLPLAQNSTIVAFGWWEEKIHMCSACC